MFGLSTLWRSFCRVLAVCAVPMVLIGPTMALDPGEQPRRESDWKAYVNTGTVRIVTSGLDCTCTTLTSDMAQVLNNMGTLRILPVVAQGSLHGVADFMHLEGIDVGIVQSDALTHVTENQYLADLQDKVRYVMKLNNSELHLIAGPGIQRIEELAGKPVSFDVEGSGTAITAQNVFDALGIVPEKVYIEHDMAIEKIKSGEIAAAFVVTGKPAKPIVAVGPEDGLHLVSIPFLGNIAENYLPASLTSEDYPNLIPQGQAVDTIAVGEFLVVYNWSEGSERYELLEQFVNALFDNFGRFLEPTRHPKWREANFGAEIPGWQRFKPAQDWLDANPQTPVMELAALKEQFRQFLADSGIVEPDDAAAQEQLFRAFLEWSQRNGSQ